MKYLLLLLLAGCATPLTEDEQFEREYEEADRKIHFIRWQEECRKSGGIVFSDNLFRPCMNKRNCIPHSWDWKWSNERPHPGNKVICISQGQMEQIFQ